MTLLKTPLLILLSLAVLQGCSHRNRTVIGGPDAEEAAIRMEESEQEYSENLFKRVDELELSVRSPREAEEACRRSLVDGDDLAQQLEAGGGQGVLALGQRSPAVGCTAAGGAPA